MGLIDAYKAMESIDEIVCSMSVCINSDYCHGMTAMKDLALHAIEKQPTVDAVPVCRCCDCKYCDKESDYEYWCGGNGFPMRLVTAEDYCSRGKRKEITL